MTIERPIDPNDPSREADRKAQIERYIRGEIIFPGQRHATREELEAGLATVALIRERR